MTVVLIRKNRFGDTQRHRRDIGNKGHMVTEVKIGVMQL